MRFLKFFFISVVVVLAITKNAYAGEKEGKIIARVIEAYGGDRLLNLTSISGTNQKFVITDIRTVSPGYEETAYRNELFIFDIQNGRASFEFVFISAARSAHIQSVFDGTEAFGINYGEGYYFSGSATDIYGVIRGALRALDTTLVWQLSQAADEAEYLGREDFQGSTHDLIRFPFPSSNAPLTLFINSETGLVSQMRVENLSSEPVRYVFKNHDCKDEITYARTTEVYLLPNLFILLDNREVEFNPSIDDAEFTIPAGVSKEPGRIDTSVKTVNRVADGIYHVGTGGTYSLFVDAGEYIIGVGNQKDVAVRLEDFKKVAGIEKPLRYQVVSLHHDEQIEGLDGLTQLGPTLVTVDDNVQTIRDAVTEDLPDERFLLVDEMLELGSDGQNPVEIYEISTSYVDRYLLFYLPVQKAAFVVDHLDTPYLENMPPGHWNTVEFSLEIDRLGLDIEIFAGAITPRLMTRAELDFAVGRHSAEPCYFDRPICS